MSLGTLSFYKLYHYLYGNTYSYARKLYKEHKKEALQCWKISVIPTITRLLFKNSMELAGVEPASRHIATQASTFIVLPFRFRFTLAVKQASCVASLISSSCSYRRKEQVYPTSYRTQT